MQILQHPDFLAWCLGTEVLAQAGRWIHHKTGGDFDSTVYQVSCVIGLVLRVWVAVLLY